MNVTNAVALNDFELALATGGKRARSAGALIFHVGDRVVYHGRNVRDAVKSHIASKTQATQENLGTVASLNLKLIGGRPTYMYRVFLDNGLTITADAEALGGA